MILRPTSLIDLILRGYWDQRFYVFLQVHLGFLADTHLEGYWLYILAENKLHHSKIYISAKNQPKPEVVHHLGSNPA